MQRQQMTHVQLQVCGQQPQMSVGPQLPPQQNLQQTVTATTSTKNNTFMSTTNNNNNNTIPTNNITVPQSHNMQMQAVADPHSLMIVSNNGNNTVHNQQQLMTGQVAQQQQQGGQGFMLEMQQQQNMNEMMMVGGGGGQQQQQPQGQHMQQQQQQQQFHPSQQKPAEVHGQVKNTSEQHRLSPPLTLHNHNDNALLPSSNTGLASPIPRGEGREVLQRQASYSPSRTNINHNINNNNNSNPSNLNITTTTTTLDTSNHLRSSVKTITLPNTNTPIISAIEDHQQQLVEKEGAAASSPRSSSVRALNSNPSSSSGATIHQQYHSTGTESTDAAAVGVFSCFGRNKSATKTQLQEITSVDNSSAAKEGGEVKNEIRLGNDVNIVVSQPINQFMKTITVGTTRQQGLNVPSQPHLTIQQQPPPQHPTSQFVIHQPGPHYHPLLHSGPAPNVTVNPNGNFQTNPNATIRATYTPFRTFGGPFQAINNFGRFAGPIQAQLAQGVQSPILAAQLQTINQMASAQMQAQAPVLHIQGGPGGVSGGTEALRKKVMPIFVSTTLHQPLQRARSPPKESNNIVTMAATGTTNNTADSHMSPMSSCTISPTSPCSSPALAKTLCSTESSTPSPQSTTSVNSLTPQPDQNIRVLTPSEIMRTLPSIPNQDALCSGGSGGGGVGAPTDRSNEFGDQVDGPSSSRAQGFKYHAQQQTSAEQGGALNSPAMVRERIATTIRFYSSNLVFSI